MTWLLFFYFLSASCEILHIKVLFFSLRPYLLISLFVFCQFFLSRRLFFDREFLMVALGCSSSLLLSTIFGEHFLSCYGLLLLFLFKFLIFFVFPSSLFLFYSPTLIYRLYFSSFVVVGLFASAQVFCSVFEIYLPFTTQRIGFFARGQAWFHEPSYYALYATPFAVFETVRYLLTKKNRRSFLASNFFLLTSTSTGCFFSYLGLLLVLFFFKCSRIIKKLSLLKTLSTFAFSLGLLGLLFWMIQPALLSQGLLKYFCSTLLITSFIPRWEGIKQFWNIFLENPFLGTGLGGASTYCARTQGLEFSFLDSDLLNASGAMNVTTEILGSLGLVGAFAFSAFFLILLRRCRQTLQLPLSEEERAHVIAMVASLSILFFTLQFNQSIMRSYVWLHVGLCVGYMNSLLERLKHSIQSL